MKSRTAVPEPINIVSFEEQKARNSAIQSIMKGNAPSNTELDDFVRQAQMFLERQKAEKAVIPEDYMVLEDTKRLLESIRLLVNNKNPDNRLQEVVNKGQRVADILGEKATSSNVEMRNVSIDSVKTMQQLSQDLRTLGTKLVTSGDFRSFLLNVVDLLQSIAHNFTDQVVEKAKTGTNAATTGSDQKQATFTTTSSTYQGVSNPPSVTSSISSANQPISASGVNVVRVPEQTTTITSTTTTQQQGYQQKQGQQSTTQALKEHGRDVIEKTRQGISDEQLDDITSKCINILVAMKQHPEYHRALHGIYHLSENTSYQKEMIKNQTRSVEDDIRDMKNILIDIIKDFSDPAAVDRAISKSNSIYTFFKDDPEIQSYFNDTHALVEQTLNDPDVVVSHRRSVIREHVKRGSLLFKRPEQKEKLRMILSVFEDLSVIFTAIKNDEDIMRLSMSTQKLTENFIKTDAQGNRTVDWELLGEMKTLLIPMIIDNLKAIQIPRIESSTAKYDLIAKNILIETNGLVPENIHFEWINKMDLAFKRTPRTVPDRASSILRIDVKNLTTRMNNIDFWFRRNTTPTIEDSGFLDILLEGRGMSITIIMEGYTDNVKLGGSGREYLGVRMINVDIDKLNLRFRDTKHDTLYSFITAIMKPTIKSRVEAMIEKNLAETIQKSYDQINTLWEKLKQETSKAATSISSTATQGLGGITGGSSGGTTGLASTLTEFLKPKNQ